MSPIVPLVGYLIFSAVDAGIERVQLTNPKASEWLEVAKIISIAVKVVFVALVTLCGAGSLLTRVFGRGPKNELAQKGLAWLLVSTGALFGWGNYRLAKKVLGERLSGISKANAHLSLMQTTVSIAVLVTSSYLPWFFAMSAGLSAYSAYNALQRKNIQAAT